MIKVAQIQFSMESGGRAALRMQRAFIKKGVQSDIVSLNYNTQVNSGITYLNKWSKVISKIDNKLQSIITRKIIPQRGSFSYPILGSDVSKLKVIKEADYIYIHWALNGMLNFNSIKKIAQLGKPVIIFLHDMWAITGGCHHSFECSKYKTTGCNACPMFTSSKKNDLSAREFKKKLKLYSSFNNFYFIAPSKWLYGCAKESLLTKNKPVFYIPNILDDAVYKKNNKAVARQLLNLPQDETIVAFGAIEISSPYKGWPYLKKALEIIHEETKDKKISVLIFGSCNKKLMDEAIPFKTVFMGYLKDEYTAALIFNAADIIIVPSLAEAFGYVVMESLSCGTPVVAFNVGGIPDLIRHKQNGYLAKLKDENDLANGIRFCLNNDVKGFLPEDLIPALTIQKHLDLLSHINDVKNK
ncbi:MAG: glycosyltransferase [Ferruginibacter sp.]|nr:glycosyltransferase [Bacteroidota bacterium]MBX2917935.1 glycosyltransferase [Ferruginibacter sp.]MCB0709189.1 glycosyltransferase [Chitinophagaceae bacterium]